MNEELQDEVIEEDTADTLENEAISEENVSNDSDTVVSDGDIVEETVLNDDDSGLTVQDDIVKKSFTKEELEEVLTSVLASEREATFQEFQAMEELQAAAEVPVRTLFNAKLNDYSVSEGLLLCIFLLLFVEFLHSVFKGSHWFYKL